MDADLEVFSEDCDLFAEVESAAKFGDGGVALGELRDGRGRKEPCGESLFSHPCAREGEELEEAAGAEEVEVGGIEAGVSVDVLTGLMRAGLAGLRPAIFDAG